jgi:hypothetical protein
LQRSRKFQQPSNALEMKTFNARFILTRRDSEMNQASGRRGESFKIRKVTDEKPAYFTWWERLNLPPCSPNPKCLLLSLFVCEELAGEPN